MYIFICINFRLRCIKKKNRKITTYLIHEIKNNQYLNQEKPYVYVYVYVKFMHQIKRSNRKFCSENSTKIP